MSRWFSHGQPRLEILWESGAIKDLAVKRMHLYRKAAPNEPLRLQHQALSDFFP